MVLDPDWHCPACLPRCVQPTSAGLSESLVSLLEDDPRWKGIIPFDKLEFCSTQAGHPVRLGSGSHGTVYKVLLDGVQPLAAKLVRLSSDTELHGTFVKVGLRCSEV